MINKDILINNIIYQKNYNSNYIIKNEMIYYVLNKGIKNYENHYNIIKCNQTIIKYYNYQI